MVNHKKNWTFGHIPMPFTICYFITRIHLCVYYLFYSFTPPMNSIRKHLKQMHRPLISLLTNERENDTFKCKSLALNECLSKAFLLRCGFLFAAITCHEKPSHSFPTANIRPRRKNKSHTCDFEFFFPQSTKIPTKYNYLASN